MSKYLISISDSDKMPYILDVYAKNMEEAEDKFINKISDIYALDISGDWKDFCEDATDHEIYIGEIYNIEEFE